MATKETPTEESTEDSTIFADAGDDAVAVDPATDVVDPAVVPDVPDTPEPTDSEPVQSSTPDPVVVPEATNVNGAADATDPHIGWTAQTGRTDAVHADEDTVAEDATVDVLDPPLDA